LVVEAGGFLVAGEARDAAAAVSAAAEEQPDLALIGAELPGGLHEAIRQIRARTPGTRIVVLTARASAEELVDVVLAGAVGYLGRDVRSERLPNILKAVRAGELALPRRYSQALVEALLGREARRSQLAARSGVALTDREREVLELLADERSTAEIAQRLGISVVTARRHISSVVAKLGVPDRAAAAALLRTRSED